MHLLINTSTDRIMSAQDTPHQVPAGDFHEVEVEGSEIGYDWPNGRAPFCLYQGGAIVTNPAYKDDRYKEQRAEIYAPLADQLDMQYWDSVHGTRIWLDHISAVKAKHPKPE